ncbi:MAG: hydroxymethylbilane synthase [Chloroflexota bacterium]
MARPLRLVSRGSQLALTQSHYVIALLEPFLGDTSIIIETVTTRGDARQDVSLTQLGEGVFVKALEAELLNGHADFAVHSLKDVPSAETDGLIIASVPTREDPRDALVTRDGRSFSELAEGALLATGSPRRVAQLRALRPDLRFTGIRGNVGTRLRKLDEGVTDGLVMAVAGLSRLGLQDRIATVFSLDECTPAAGQGALGAQCRANDDTMLPLLGSIDDSGAHAETRAERSFLAAIGGGCQVPVGALATREGNTLRLRAVVADPHGQIVVRSNQVGSPDNADLIGQAAASELEETLKRFQVALTRPS